MREAMVGAFLAHLPPELEVDLSRIEPVLLKIADDVESAWPQLHLELEDFVAHLAARIPLGQPVVKTLENLHHADLYLACACANGDEAAFRLFTAAYDSVIERAAKRVEAQGVDADETRQLLINHLLLPRGERPPAIALYSGQGALFSYLKVAALHKALKLLEKFKKVPITDDLEDAFMVADSSDDPEIAVLKRTYKTEFKKAFQGAMADLSSEERNILRYHYLKGLNTRQIAPLCGVDQSTVVRMLARIRGSLLSSTRERLMADLGLGQSKFGSILNLVQSQLDMSISRVLGGVKED